MFVRLRIAFTAIFLAIMVLSTAFPTMEANAAFNEQINYQGKLTDLNNIAVPNGSYTMVFRLYNVSSGGTALWTETRSVTVTNGLFSVMLGGVTPFGPLDFDQTLYLGVKIESDSEMSPRKVLGAVPAAMVAKRLGTNVASDFLRSNENDEFEAGKTLTITGTLDTNGEVSFADADISFDGANTNFSTTGNWSVNGNNIFINKNSGTVGINSSASSTNKLEVGGNTQVNGVLNINNGGTIFRSGNELRLSGNLEVGLYSGSNNILFANATGVGIGTTSPSYKLDVFGGTGISARFSGRVIGGNAVNTNEFTTLSQLNSALSSATSTLPTTYFARNGNSFGGLATLGTNDANDLVFETNNVSRMRIDTSGRVGIGANPQVGTNLLVSASSSTMPTELFIRNTTTPGQSRILLGLDYVSNLYGGMMYDNSGIDLIINNAASFNGGDILFQTGSTPKMTLTNQGFLGINTQNPSSLLHVNTTNQSGYVASFSDEITYKGISIGNAAMFSGDEFGIYDTTGDQAVAIVDYDGGNYKMIYGGGMIRTNQIDGTIYLDDKVGIGTTTPANKLHVNSSGTTYGSIGMRLSNSIDTTNSQFDIGAGWNGNYAGSLLFAKNSSPIFMADQYGISMFSGKKVNFQGNSGINSMENGNTAVMLDSGLGVTSSGLNYNRFMISGNEIGRFDADGLGLGTTNPAHKFESWSTKTSGENYGVYSSMTAGAGATSGTYVGLGGRGVVNGGTVSGSTLVGLQGYVGSNNSTVSGTNGIAVQGLLPTGATNESGASFSNLYAFYGGGATLDSGSATNAYGLYLEGMKATGVTNGYGVYQSGANDRNYFAGNVGIGTSTIAHPLTVSGNVFSSSGTYLTGTNSSAFVGTGPRAVTTFGLSTVGNALITNDIAGARYAQTTGDYDLTWYKHVSSDDKYYPSFSIDSSGPNAYPEGYTFRIGATATATPAMKIVSSGNVGIGTASPNAKLEINGDEENLLSVNSSYFGNLVNVFSSIGSYYYSVKVGSIFMDNYNNIWDTSNMIDIGDISGIQTGAVFKIDPYDGEFLFNGGMVGIGTSIPIYALDVNGGTGITARFSGRVIGGNAVNSNEFVTLSQLTASTSNAFVNNGNSFGSLATLGTNDNNALAFETNGTERMRIGSNGSVSIGTTTSDAALTVVNDSLYTKINIKESQNYGGASIFYATDDYISFSSWGGAEMLGLNRDGNQIYLNSQSFFSAAPILYGGAQIGDGGYNAIIPIGSGGEDGLSFDAGYAQRMVIRSDGKVGIGTSTPAKKLDIADNTSETTLRLSNYSGSPHFIDIASVDGPAGTERLDFRISGTSNRSLMSMMGNGNIGIGTITPTEKLHVEGKLNVSDSIIASTGIAANAVHTIGRLQISYAGSGNPTISSTATANGVIGLGSTLNWYTADPAFTTSHPSAFKFAHGRTGQPILFQTVKPTDPNYTYTDTLSISAAKTSILTGFLQILPDENDSNYAKLALHASHTNTSQQLFTGLTYSNAAGFMAVGGGTSLNLFLDAGSTANYGSHIFRKASWNGTSKVFTEVARIDSVGNFGLGTSTPSTMLSLATHSTAAGGINFGDATSNLYRSGVGALRTDGALSVGNSIYVSDGTGLSNGSTGNNAILRMNNNGAILTRNIADSNPAFIIQQANAGSTGDVLQVKNNASTLFSINQGGNLGLGTTTDSMIGSKFAFVKNTLGQIKGVEINVQGGQSVTGSGIYGLHVISNATQSAVENYAIYAEKKGTSDYGAAIYANGDTGIKVDSTYTGLEILNNSAFGRSISSTQVNSSGYNIYATGGKNYFDGNVGIGSNRYLNFGLTSGSSGYGIRDNGGVIEFKNSGGSWTVLGSSGSGAQISPTDLYEFSHFENSGVNSMDPYTGSALASGTVNATAAANTDAKYPGTVLFRSSTTANSGYRVGTTQTLHLMGPNQFYEAILKSYGLSTATTRFGFHDTANQTDATDGVYFELVGNTLVGKTAKAGTRSTTTTNYTVPTGALDYYKYRISMNSDATIAYFKVYDTAGSLVWSESLTTNIPTATTNVTGIAVVTTSSGTVASDLIALDYMGEGTVAGYDAMMSTGSGLWTQMGNNVTYTQGSVGIGTTTPTTQLHTTGSVRFSAFGAGTLVTDANGNVSVSSDERLKTVSGEFTKGLNEIVGLKPIAYTWKSETGYDTVHTYYGFSAQNVQAFIPEAVGVNDNGYLTLQDRPLLAASINAIKELNLRVEDIEKIIAQSASSTASTTPPTFSGSFFGPIANTFDTFVDNGKTIFANFFTRIITIVEKDDEANMTGEGIIRSGEGSVRINNPLVTPTSRIIITPTSSLGGREWYVSEKRDGYFVMSLDDRTDHDITFDYMVISVDRSRRQNYTGNEGTGQGSNTVITPPQSPNPSDPTPPPAPDSSSAPAPTPDPTTDPAPAEPVQQPEPEVQPPAPEPAPEPEAAPEVPSAPASE